MSLRSIHLLDSSVECKKGRAFISLRRQANPVDLLMVESLFRDYPEPSAGSKVTTAEASVQERAQTAQVKRLIRTTCAQDNLMLGHDRQAVLVICRMCYTCVCELRWSFASSAMRQGRRYQVVLMEVTGATR